MFRLVNSVATFSAHLQLVSVLASVIAHHFCFPSVRHRQIVQEKIAPVRLGNSQSADNVLICFQEAYVSYSKFVAVTKVYFDFLIIGKVVPKFVVASELQALHNFILSSRMKLCVQLFNRFGNLGLKYAALTFQPMH